MKSKAVCGVYRIFNTATTKVYTGSSQNIEQRWKVHRQKLRTGKHENSYLQRAWNKYGEACFVFEVLEPVPVETLLEKEQAHLDRVPKKRRYNTGALVETPWRGRKQTRASRQKTSEGLRRVHADPAWRARQSAIMKAALKDPALRARRAETLRRTLATLAVKERRSIARKKVWADPAARQRQSETVKRALANPEIRARRTAALRKALARPEIAQARSAAIGAAAKARWKDPEMRRRMNQRRSRKEVRERL